MILAVFAHPDDEIGVGSTLAYYSLARTVPVTLVCASRGEAATIFCADCATPENLAEVRTRELECSCRHLGISDLRWLDWRDGGIKEVPMEIAVGAIVAIVRELQPDVVLTHPKDGLYPHPDHLAMWEIVRAACEMAADPAAYPEHGRPWSVPRLFTRALPQSFFDAVPEFARYRVELNGQLLPFYATPDEQISVRMQVSPWSEKRMTAWDCHRSQHNPNSPFSGLPDGVRREMAETECFVLAAGRVPMPPGSSDDLLAGLEADVPAADPKLVSALRTSLAEHRAFAAVLEGYQQDSSEREVIPLLRELIDAEREIIYLIAHALRSLGEVVGKVSPDDRLMVSARRARNTEARLRFVQDWLRKALAGYQAKAQNAPDANHRETWREIANIMSNQLASARWPELT